MLYGSEEVSDHCKHSKREEEKNQKPWNVIFFCFWLFLQLDQLNIEKVGENKDDPVGRKWTQDIEYCSNVIYGYGNHDWD